MQPRLDERREELGRVVVVVVNEDGHADKVGPGVVNGINAMTKNAKMIYEMTTVLIRNMCSDQIGCTIGFVN